MKDTYTVLPLHKKPHKEPRWAMPSEEEQISFQTFLREESELLDRETHKTKEDEVLVREPKDKRQEAKPEGFSLPSSANQRKSESPHLIAV